MTARRGFTTVGMTAIALACGGAGPTASDDSTNGGSVSGTVPDAFKGYASTVQVSVEGDYVVLRATGIPDHKSPYFATSDSRYEKYNGTNASYAAAPGTIVAQTYVFRIPLKPAKAAQATATPLGPIGLAFNGVPFFNQYNGQNRPLTMEIDSFDQYNGHPTPTNAYHYHVEPVSLTRTKGMSALLGFLLDGYPVYGPVESGKRLTNADLDALHGHTSATADYPSGIYHYHVTDADPYINGAGFYGTPGTLGR